MDVVENARETIEAHGLAQSDTPVLLMVSGGSDSTALAYIAQELAEQKVIGPLAMLHVNHKIRGKDADDDAAFVAQLADSLHIPLFACDIDIPSMVDAEGGNVEAIARRERYRAAQEALVSLCRHFNAPVSSGRIFTAHTADDRIENFYMRSIVGTGPGGFRSMLYLNGQIARPLLEVERQDLRDYITARPQALKDEQGALWREDATNEHTDRFRAFVRTHIVPAAKERNPQLARTLTRTMNLIADEDDMLDARATDLEERYVRWIEQAGSAVADYGEGCVLMPGLAKEPQPLKRRVLMNVLGKILGPDARVETASIDAVLAAYAPCDNKAVPCIEDEEAFEDEGVTDEARAGRLGIVSGYAANIQGDLAVSANKKGVRIEPMVVFRARRKRG